MGNYIYSTITNGTFYCKYKESQHGNVAIMETWPNGKPMKVEIHGGHGMSNKHFLTPKGVCTQVTDDELEMLMNNDAFKRHMDAGFITVDKKKVNPEKKAANMEEKDASAPLTPADYVKGDGENTYKMKNPLKDKQ